MPSSTAETRPDAHGSRFEITVSLDRGSHRIVVRDRQSSRPLFRWTGWIASQVIASGALPPQAAAGVTHFGDKGFVQHLSLLAASAELASHALPEAAAENRAADEPDMSVANPGSMRWSRLSARLRRLNASLGRDETTVARLLFSKPGQHFSSDDVTCLLELRDRPLPSSRVGAALDNLTVLGVIQRIDVAPGRAFYDIDTRPHLHLYDEAKGELRDAEVEGVIGYGGGDAVAKLRLVNGNRVRILPDDPSRAAEP